VVVTCLKSSGIRYTFQESTKPHTEVWAIERCKTSTYSFNPKYLKAGPEFEWESGAERLTCFDKDDTAKRAKDPNQEDRSLKARPSTAPLAPSSSSGSSKQGDRD
jgi:hypothetical protein